MQTNELVTGERGVQGNLDTILPERIGRVACLCAQRVQWSSFDMSRRCTVDALLNARGLFYLSVHGKVCYLSLLILPGQ